jgi:ankyrin repeat protein
MMAQIHYFISQQEISKLILNRIIESGDLYKKLLPKYISPDAKNKNGDTLLHLLLRRFTACPIPIKEAVKILLKAG